MATIRNDRLVGQDDDRIFGFAGNDTIFGGSGSDYIDGGAGNDRLFIDSNGQTAGEPR